MTPKKWAKMAAKWPISAVYLSLLMECFSLERPGAVKGAPSRGTSHAGVSRRVRGTPMDRDPLNLRAVPSVRGFRIFSQPSPYAPRFGFATMPSKSRSQASPKNSRPSRSTWPRVQHHGWLLWHEVPKKALSLDQWQRLQIPPVQPEDVENKERGRTAAGGAGYNCACD